MKMLIAAGGTGGHLFPGIAVAETVKHLVPDAEIAFVGSERGLEQEILEREGFSHEALRVGRIKGEGVIQRFKTMISLPKSFLQASEILRRQAPEIVFGIGGYSSGPMILAAFFSKIPRAILEPNAIPGFTNRMLSRFATRIFIAFPETGRFFPRKRTRLTGTPVRESLKAKVLQKTQDEPFCLAILGGSQGAHSLNLAVIRLLPQLKQSGRRFHMVHQTGARDFEMVRKAYQESSVSHEVKPFFEDMGSVYRKADLVVSRSGASTVAELMETQMPSILVPYPFAADDHQRFNARSIVRAGGGEMILDDQLEEEFAERILYLESHREELKTMRKNLSHMRKVPAAEAVARECLELIGL